MEQISKHAESISKLNALDAKDVTNLITHYCFSFCSYREFIFSEEKANKLCHSLNVTLIDLKNLLEFTKDVIMMAAHNSLEPSALESLLEKNGVHKNHSETFSSLWGAYGKWIISIMKKSSLAAWQLIGVTWKLLVETASTYTARHRRPLAMLELHLQEPIPSEDIATIQNKESLSKKHKILLQMDYNQLLEFFEHLENVQAQMNSLK